MKKIYLLVLAIILCLNNLRGGNPDRQGEAGAYELLLNPWARSLGFYTMNTSFIKGVEAMRLNVAGLTGINRTEVLIGHSRYLSGTDIALNGLGLAQRVGDNGVLGISIVSLDFGDLIETTVQSPDGTGATFSPSFFHLGVAYAHRFDNKVSVGILFRTISESTADLTAFGFALDAGIQYVAGPKDNFKFGISLRNVGSPMKFGGEGLSFQGENKDNNTIYDLTYEQRAASFDLPSLLNIGMSYDFYATKNHRITALGNFTANSFSRDQLGGGVEYSLREIFSIRAGYKHELGANQHSVDRSVFTGFSAGASFDMPLKKGSSRRLGIDYGYLTSRVFNGTHNLSVRISI